jgi:monoterpene epsilon-lactone hydrolase
MNTHNPRILSAIFRHLKSRPSITSVGILEYRNSLEKSAQAFKPDPVVQFNSFSIGHIQAAWLTPEGYDPSRIILYVHGGGYIAGSILSHRDLASRIARAARAKVLIFNYRLAPEHPFPAGLDDLQTVYEWLSSAIIPPTTHISLVGDSAGAGLCLAFLTSLLNKNKPLPACAVFISPWVDLSCKNQSFKANQDKDPMLNQKQLLETARLYTDKSLCHPLVSPIHNTFKGLPPMLIQAGENEVLLDDSNILAQKIKDSKGNVTLEIWDEMFHVWHYFAKYLSQGKAAIEGIGRFIKQHS